MSTSPVVTINGSTVVFTVDLKTATSPRGRMFTRRAAVKMIASTPRLRDGISRYRFDALDGDSRIKDVF